MINLYEQPMSASPEDDTHAELVAAGVEEAVGADAPGSVLAQAAALKAQGQTMMALAAHAPGGPAAVAVQMAAANAILLKAGALEAQARGDAATAAKLHAASQETPAVALNAPHPFVEGATVADVLAAPAIAQAATPPAAAHAAAVSASERASVLTQASRRRAWVTHYATHTHA